MEGGSTAREVELLDRQAKLTDFLQNRYRWPFGMGVGAADFSTFGNIHTLGELRNRLAGPDVGAWPQNEAELARIRSHDPWAYYAGQALTGAANALVVPHLVAAQTGAAIANVPAVRRAYRESLPASAMSIAAPIHLLLQGARKAFDRQED
jgi:hypothetical protein